MSKFRARLRQTAQGAKHRPIGFTPQAPASKQPQLLIAAQADDASAAPELTSAGAGALVTTNLGELAPLAAAAAADDVPVGFHRDATTASDADRAITAGADFIIFDHTETEAAALLDPDVGRVLHLTAPATDEELRGFAAFHLDAVLVATPPEPLLVADQLSLRRVANLAGAPLIVVVPNSPGVATLHSWRDAGVLVALVPADPMAIRTAVEASSEVPPLKRPPDDRGQLALVPALSGTPADFDEDF